MGAHDDGVSKTRLFLGILSLLIIGDRGDYGSDGDQEPVGRDLKHVWWSPRGSSLGDWRGDYDSLGDGNRVTRRWFVKAVGPRFDVPLGWPDAFVTAVTAHHEGRAWPGGSQRSLCFRETDRVVHRETRWPPLSVSSNLIAIPAMRAAAVLSALAARGTPVNRAGRGRIVEVYPAAALRRWGLPASGYKKKGQAVRCELVGQLQHEAGWLRLPDEVAACCEADDNGLDALIAALVTRAAACGLCEAIPDESLALAEREGWIALPKPGSLRQLAEAKPVLA